MGSHWLSKKGDIWCPVKDGELDINVPPSPPKTPLIDNKKIFLWYRGHGQREQERLQQKHFGSWINGNQFINLKNLVQSQE